MRVSGYVAATMRVAASALALFLLAATRAAPVQQLEQQMRAELSGVSQSGAATQVTPPEGNTLRAGLTERFNGAIEARIGGCNQKTATAIADALAPRISPNLVDGAMAAWERYDVATGGHPIGVRVGLGKEFLGYANGQAVQDRWISFHVNVGLFGPNRSCRS